MVYATDTVNTDPNASPPQEETILENRVNGNSGPLQRSLKNRLVRGGLWVLFGRVAGIIATVIMNALLARELSYEEFGAFFVAKTSAAAIAVGAMLGWNTVLVRFLAERFARGDARGARNYLRLGCATVTISSSVWLILILGPIGQELGRWLNIPTPGTVMPLVACWMCLSAWHQFFAEGLRGCHEQRLANLLSGETGGAVANILFCLALACLLTVTKPTLVLCLWMNVVILATLLPISGMLFWWTFRERCRASDGTAGEFQQGDWSIIGTVCVPIMLLQIMAIVINQGDLWLASLYCNSEERAMFAAARRLVYLIAVPQWLANLTVLPTIAEMFAHGHRHELQRLLQATATMAAIPALMATLVLLACPDMVLDLVFGPQYRGAAWPVIILALGQFIFALTGSCGNALTMTGRHHEMLWINGVVAAGILLVGPWATTVGGAAGLATVAACGLAIQNILSWIRARQTLGVWTHASWKYVLPSELRGYFSRTPQLRASSFTCSDKDLGSSDS